tara:strand:- start:620 stop:736 length:117 start_codon:yes stop_codon:yes gene_type:complete
MNGNGAKVRALALQCMIREITAVLFTVGNSRMREQLTL